MQKDQEKISQRAYDIWDREGRQDGQADEHWAQAERELGSSRTGESSGTEEPLTPVQPTSPAEPESPIKAKGPAGAKSPAPSSNKKANGAAISVSKSSEGGPRKRRGAQATSQG